jgi:4-amino-4-deoxy-L-arabinose transferase-like glycosyltransferase
MSIFGGNETVRLADKRLVLFAIVLISCGLLQRVFWFLHSDIWVSGIGGANIAKADTGAYIEMSYGLLSYWDNDERMPFVPLLFRIVRVLFGPEVWKLVAFNQLISLATIAALYPLCRNCLSKNWSFFVIGIYLVEPITAYWANGIHTESVFVVFVLAGVACLVPGLNKGRLGLLTTGSVFFGLAVLTRPNGWYFVYLVPLLCVVFSSGPPVFRLGRGALSFVIMILIAAPWMAFHYWEYGSTNVSTATGRQLLDVEAVRVMSKATNRPEQEVRQELHARVGKKDLDNPFDLAKAQIRVATAVILDYLPTYIAMRMRSTVKLFLGAGDRTLCTTYLNKSLESSNRFKSFNQLPFNERIIEKVKYRISNMTACEWAVNISVTVFHLWLYFGVCCGLLFLCRRKFSRSCKNLFVLSVIMIGYFSVFVHSLPEARFRLAMIPFLVLISIMGYREIFSWRPSTIREN